MNTKQEIQYLIGAIQQVERERVSLDSMERLMTLHKCLMIASQKLISEDSIKTEIGV